MITSISVTPLGLVFLAAFTYGMFRPRALPWILSASMAFPQSALLVVGTNIGLTPFHAGVMVCTARLLLWAGPEGRSGRLPGAPTACLAALAVYSGLITVLGPYLFAGVEVLTPRGGIDNQAHSGTPLVFTMSNVAQYVYMLLGIALVVVLTRGPRLGTTVLIPGLSLGIGLSTVRLAVDAVGLRWPTELFDTMPGYGYALYGDRLRGVFSEPAVLGGFAAAALAVFATQFFATEKFRPRARALLCLGVLASAVCLVSTRSATGFVTAVVLAAVIAGSKIVRSDAGGRLLPVYLLGGIAAAGFLVWRGTGVIAGLLGVLPAKLATESFTNRFASDVAGLEILVQSHFLGVGLGSSRSSSLATTMLSCIGVLGVAAFLVLTVVALRSGLPHSRFRGAAWGLFACVTAQVVALPDLSTPVLWFLLGACLSGTRAADRTADPQHERGAPLFPEASGHVVIGAGVGGRRLVGAESRRRASFAATTTVR